jgi:hypothetical protein
MLFFFAAYHLFWLLIFFVLIKMKNKQRLFAFIAMLRKYRVYVLVLFFMSIFSSRNFLNVTRDLISGTAWHYNAEAKQRLDFLKNCHSDTCYVDKHKFWASSIEYFREEDINTKPFIHIDKYYGKKILFKQETSLQK